MAKLIDSISTVLFNVKEKLFHKITEEENSLILKTHLFDYLDDKHLKKLKKSIYLIKFQKGKIILKEGSRGGAIYIIKEGSVKVYTQDSSGNKIPLNKLSKGDYFGEQALLGAFPHTRKATVEASSTPTILIKVNEKLYSYLIQMDPLLRAELRKKGYQYAVAKSTAMVHFYKNIYSYISNVKNPKIQNYKADEIIFKIKDKADNIYFIDEGQIKLIFENKSEIILHKGNIFGELGILENQPRSATAIAETPVRLIAVKSEDFLQFLDSANAFKDLFGHLIQSYQIPSRGTIIQYLGQLGESGFAKTTLYKLEDGEMVVATSYLADDVFTMTRIKEMGGQVYTYKEGNDRIEIGVRNNTLTSITAHGKFESLPTLSQVLLDRIQIKEEDLKVFEEKGTFATVQTKNNGKALF